MGNLMSVTRLSIALGLNWPGAFLRLATLLATLWQRFCSSKQRIGEEKTGLKPNKIDLNTPIFCTGGVGVVGSNPAAPTIIN